MKEICPYFYYKTPLHKTIFSKPTEFLSYMGEGSFQEENIIIVKGILL